MKKHVRVGESFFYSGTLQEEWSMCLRDPAFWTAIVLLMTAWSLIL